MADVLSYKRFQIKQRIKELEKALGRVETDSIVHALRLEELEKLKKDLEEN